MPGQLIQWVGRVPLSEHTTDEEVTVKCEAQMADSSLVSDALSSIWDMKKKNKKIKYHAWA
jgi:hypothetical protein